MVFNNTISIKSGILTFVLICFLLTVGCSALRDIAGSIQKPTLSVTDVQVSAFAFDEIELTYDVTVDNPNSVAVQMASYNYDFKLNNETFFEGQQDKSMKIEASDKSTFEVPMKLNFKKVHKGIRTLANADEADYEFLSVVSFELPVLGITEVPVRKKGTLPMINTPKISVINLEVQSLSLTKAELILNLEFDNPNAFGINVNSFDYNLTINGDQWAEGNALNNTLIPKKETAELEIPLTLNITEMGMSAYRLLTGSQELNYRLNGDFDLGTTHPLLDQTNFKINRKGSVSLSDN